MTKKIIALLLALIMLFSLAACGGDSEDEKDEDEKVEENEKDEDEKDEDKSDKDEDKSDKDDKDDEDDKDLVIKGKYELLECDVDEAELYSDDVMSITVTKLEFLGDWGAQIYFDVTNNTDQNVEISTDMFIVNGFSTNTYGYAKCKPGATEELDAYFDLSELEMLDIRYIKDIEVTFEAMDEDFETVGYSQRIKFSTNAPKNYVQNTDLGGELVLEGDDFKLYYMGCTAYNNEYLYVNFYLDHTGNYSEVAIEFNSFLINGYSFNDAAYLGIQLTGYGMIDNTILTPDELAEHEIEISDIETLEFSFSAYDYENWVQVDIDSEPVTIEDVEVVETEW